MALDELYGNNFEDTGTYQGYVFEKGDPAPYEHGSPVYIRDDERIVKFFYDTWAERREFEGFRDTVDRWIQEYES